MRIAVCDDEQAQCALLSGYLKEWAKERRIASEISCFYSAESFLFSWEEETFDLLLLDIEMGDLDGISLAKKLRQDNQTLQIVFITGFPDFMAQGYEVSAVHYLLKPVGEETMARVLERAAANCKRAQKALIFSVEGESVRVDTGEILYAEALAHFCRINTRDGAFEVRLNFSQLEKCWERALSGPTALILCGLVRYGALVRQRSRWMAGKRYRSHEAAARL